MSDPKQAELVISCGDPGGVGPILALRAAQVALQQNAERIVTLVGDASWLEPELEIASIAAKVDDTGKWRACDVHEPNADNGAAQVAMLERGAELALESSAVLLTAPTCKASVHLAGHRDFTGQTELLARAAGLKRDGVSMLFIGPNLCVATVTTHCAISAVPTEMSQPRVERTLRHASEAFRRVGKSRLLVCGLNPHAGEAGAFGSEESRIEAAISQVEPELALRVDGPLGAETALRWGVTRPDAGVVAMFHDQATIASKLVDWGAAANVTWGLPFLRVSVDHGAAFDARARGEIRDEGMLAALGWGNHLGRAE